MDTQMRKGVLELCVLALTDQQDCYGYELVQKLNQHLPVNEGTIYPILRRLTCDGLCETYMKESSNGPARKYYHITVSGKNRLQESYQEWKDLSQRIEDLLKEVGL